MKLKSLFHASLIAAGVAAGGHALAAGTTKDIVVDRVAAPASVAPAAATDAMIVSVLRESPDGSLTPKSTETLFATGDRFRVKVAASRSGKLSIYNTTPRGELKPQPVWQGTVAVGEETITPRLVIDNTSGAGTELLHIVLEPTAPPQGVIVWLTGWLASKSGKAGAPKDIRVDSQSTASATYVLNPTGQGLETTLRITHTAR